MVIKFIKSGFNKVKSVVSRTTSKFNKKLESLFSKGINEKSLDELEELLYEADLGVHIAVEFTNKIRELGKQNPQITPKELIEFLKKECLTILSEFSPTLKTVDPGKGPLTIFFIGVNGNGKTTSLGKLANLFKQENKKVLVGAADTFRAAAIDQVQQWTDLAQVDLVKGLPKSDPAAVIFDTMSAGKARDVDVILVDTAGRLQTKKDLMQELEKMRRSCGKVIPDAPHETFLVLDASTGQNAIDQAKVFNSFTPITGLILTKLDGSAKGGIVISIIKQLKIPIKFIGVGEGIDDIELFDPKSFVDGLFAES